MIWIFGLLVAIGGSTHYFGEVPEHKILNHSFTIRNDGPQDVKILNVSTSCACTAAKYPKVIEKGKSKKIVISLNTKGLKGYVERNAIVITDAKKDGYLLLKVSATVQ